MSAVAWGVSLRVPSRLPRVPFASRYAVLLMPIAVADVLDAFRICAACAPNTMPTLPDASVRFEAPSIAPLKKSTPTLAANRAAIGPTNFLAPANIPPPNLLPPAAPAALMCGSMPLDSLELKPLRPGKTDNVTYPIPAMSGPRQSVERLGDDDFGLSYRAVVGDAVSARVEPPAGLCGVAVCQCVGHRAQTAQEDRRGCDGGLSVLRVEDGERSPVLAVCGGVDRLLCGVEATRVGPKTPLVDSLGSGHVICLSLVGSCWGPGGGRGTARRFRGCRRVGAGRAARIGSRVRCRTLGSWSRSWLRLPTLVGVFENPSQLCDVLPHGQTRTDRDCVSEVVLDRVAPPVHPRRVHAGIANTSSVHVTH